QPSGAARSQEMRDRFPLSSLLWQVPHFAITSGSATGMPSSGFTSADAAGGVPGACASIGITPNKARSVTKAATFAILLSFAVTLFHKTSSSESQARAELDRARAAVLCALQAADRAERRRAEIHIGYTVVGMVEQVGRRGANPESIALLISKAPIDGKRDDLRAGADDSSDRRSAEAADIIRRHRERR